MRRYRVGWIGEADYPKDYVLGGTTYVLTYEVFQREVVAECPEATELAAEEID